MNYKIAVLGGGVSGTVLSKEISSRTSCIVDLYERSKSLGGLNKSIRIEKRLEDFGDILQKKFSKNDSDIASGFVATTLIYCIGPLAIIGALNSGLVGDHSILFSNLFRGRNDFTI